MKKVVSPAQRSAIRDKIIRIRVIKGGRGYIRRCNRRILRYQRLYKAKPSAILKRKIQIGTRRYYRAKKFYMTNSVKQERNRVFKKVIVKKRVNPSRTVYRPRRPIRRIIRRTPIRRVIRRRPVRKVYRRRPVRRIIRRRPVNKIQKKKLLK
jgi:hypothetical protein